MRIPQAPNKLTNKAHKMESIKNKSIGNTFCQFEENKFFLAGPAAAISLANPLAQNSWEEQKALKRRHGGGGVGDGLK